MCPKGQGELRERALCGGQGVNEGAEAELAPERSHRDQGEGKQSQDTGRHILDTEA